LHQNSPMMQPEYKNSSYQTHVACRRCCILLAILFAFSAATAQQKDSTSLPKGKEWYKRINIRGYAQLRYNRLLETNKNLGCEQCDKSWGGDNGFFFRRIRVILFGQIHERVYIYIQPDFASSAGSGVNNFAQIRDAYFDVGLDRKNEFRLRFGQSKVPFGFENLQSSQNRLALDRADPVNSALNNERDIGIFAYWAPSEIRERFAFLVSSGLKGSGDYGVVGFGVYNGQTANRTEQNGKPMVVTRVSYPFKIGQQFVEPGLQAYSGYTVVTGITDGVTGINPDFEYKDQRIGATLVIYPQPFGLNAEYNVGTGPEYNPGTNAIEQQRLKGGYAMASYQAKFGQQLLTPFVRYQYYDGGKKHELDARSYTVRDLEIGAEWQPIKPLEMVVTYTVSNRRYEDSVKRSNHQEGSLLRLQFQVNF
jgi:hypothetical protein